jgi:hypothetical protein
LTSLWTKFWKLLEFGDKLHGLLKVGGVPAVLRNAMLLCYFEQPLEQVLEAAGVWGQAGRAAQGGNSAPCFEKPCCGAPAWTARAYCALLLHCVAAPNTVDIEKRPVNTLFLFCNDCLLL